MPAEEGCYTENHDGTFTKVAYNTKLEIWRHRLTVSEGAAADAANGERPLALRVEDGCMAVLPGK